MALVHSLWTKPMLKKARSINMNKQLEATIWCTASSVAFAKLNNEKIHLYADELACQILDFLPYDEVKPLNIPDDFPYQFWAAGKFFALQQMQLGDIHIDTDVFIKNKKLMDTINDGLKNNDLIIQSIENTWTEHNEFYQRCHQVIQDNNIPLPQNMQTNIIKAYNCGIVGFNNEEFKQLYIDCYFQSVQNITQNKNAMTMIQNNNLIWMDLMCEQQFLYQIAQNKNYSVYNLLGEGYDVYANALDLGYQHLLGKDKWTLIEQTKQQLSTYCPSIFIKTQNKINNYK